MLLKEIGKAKARVLAAAGYEPEKSLEPEDNGEYRFLNWVSSLPEICAYNAVIDIGANHGDWTEAARNALGGQHIKTFYCVEPIPWLTETIRKRFSSPPDVEVAEVALSDSGGGEVTIFNSGGGGGMYRSYRGNAAEQANSQPQKKYVEYKVQLKKGDDLFHSPSIKPYLLKVDCDGHDYKVLAGCSDVLAKKRPIVQFEYCDFWIGSSTRLRNACDLFARVGYKTYKMFPDRLVPFRYNMLFETFGYQNIIAVPAEMASFKAPPKFTLTAAS